MHFFETRASQDFENSSLTPRFHSCELKDYKCATITCVTDPQSYRPKTSDIPLDPGVYRFIDADDRVIYVGKAKSLRKRLVNYFQPLERLHPRTQKMVTTAVRVVWVVVASEVEALTLEYAWIKEFTPRFNVIFRDDKSYPYLAVTTSEKYPRLMYTRKAHRKGNKYYGPYTKGSLRDSVDLLLSVFPVRSCSAGVFAGAQRAGRPCLNGYIDKCCAPCVGRVSEGEHRELVNSLVRFLDSDGSALIDAKTVAMLEAATREEFEVAAKLRDEIEALRRLAEKNTLVMEQNVDADVFGIEYDELEASVQVFFIRGGRIRGQRGWVSDIEELNEAELLREMLMHVYGERASDSDTPSNSAKPRTLATSPDDVTHTSSDAIPREIWLPAASADQSATEEWLTSLRGAPVHLRTPQRGNKAAFMATVHENAKQALLRHKLARSGDLTERSQALEELREGLGLERAPLRIECYDISHTQGSYQVASMVVFEDGLAKKADYRHFIVRGENGEGASDDTAAMREVLTRRLARLSSGAAPDDASDDEPLAGSGELQSSDASNQPKRFAYRPDLIVVDGGLPQVNAVKDVIETYAPDVQVIGLAKRLEEVWIPGEDFPLILPRQSASLRLLQFVRDESHRFAITFHRKKRSKGMTRSALDAVPGLGPAKQKALLKHFGSLTKIKEASVEELQAAPGIGPVMAKQILESLGRS